MSVTSGQRVKISCKSFLQDGTSLDNPEDNEPIIMEAGLTTDNHVVSAISGALIGMNFGDIKTIDLEPDKAFGEIDSDKVVTVPRDNIEAELNEGDVVHVDVGEEDYNDAVVKSVGSDTVVLDFNHPLAGHTISFEINLLGPEDAK